MAKYDITSTMLTEAVSAYYKNDFTTMLNCLHSKVTFLFTGKNHLIEGREQLEAIIEKNTQSLEQQKIKYEILEMSCKSYTIRPYSCYSILQMEIRAHLPNGRMSQVNQRIVVYWQLFQRLQYAKNDYREGWFAMQVHASIAADSLLEVINKEKRPENILHGAVNTIESEPIIEDPYEVRDQTKKLRYISKKQMKRILGNGPYSIIILADGSQMKIHKKLDDFETELSPYGFVRIHKSHLVNSLYVKSISSYRMGMTDGTVLPVAKVRYRDVKAQFGK